MITDEEIDYLTRGNRYPGTLQGSQNFARAIADLAVRMNVHWEDNHE